MTAETNGPTRDVEALPTDIEILTDDLDGIPPEWITWATAIEQREDLRYRVSRGPERNRFTEMVAIHSAQKGVLDWTDETLDFVAKLREGSDRPENHPKPRRRRWSLNRRKRSERQASR